MCRFLNNLGGICMLAFFGTAISTIVIAVFMWLLGVLHLSFKISFLHASLFGAIISATDPVCVVHIECSVQIMAALYGGFGDICRLVCRSQCWLFSVGCMQTVISML